MLIWPFSVCFITLTKSLYNGDDTHIFRTKRHRYEYKYKYWILIFGCHRFYNTPRGADKLSYRTNARFSICLHRLVCCRIDDILKSAFNALLNCAGLWTHFKQKTWSVSERVLRQKGIIKWGFYETVYIFMLYVC